MCGGERPKPSSKPTPSPAEADSGPPNSAKRAKGNKTATPLAVPKPVVIGVDVFSPKGQRVSSSFPFMSLFRRIKRRIESSRQRGVVVIEAMNGYRSSRQAAGLLSFAAGLGRCDHRAVQLTDLGPDWKGSPVAGFHYVFCPITEAVHQRDRPAERNMIAVSACHVHSAPRPAIFSPLSQ